MMSTCELWRIIVNVCWTKILQDGGRCHGQGDGEGGGPDAGCETVPDQQGRAASSIMWIFDKRHLGDVDKVTAAGPGKKKVTGEKDHN